MAVVVLCLDTSGFSSFMRGDQASVRLLESADSVSVPTIVLGELYAGFSMGTRQRENMSQLSSFLNRPAIQVQPISQAIALRYGDIMKLLRSQGTPIPMNDVWIAATALHLGAALLAFDEHFSKIPLLQLLP